MRKFSVRPVLEVFWQHLSRYKLAFFVVLFCAALLEIFRVVVPLYYKDLFDLIASTKNPTDETTSALLAILGTIMLIQLGGWALRRVNQFLSVHVVSRVMYDLSETAFANVLGHSYDFFTNNFAGSLVRKITRLSQSFQQFWDQVTDDFLPIAVSLIGIVGVLFMEHHILGGLFLLWVVVFISLQVFISRWKVKYNVIKAEKDSASTGVISDAITNNITFKLFTGETEEKALFSKISNELMRAREVSWNFDNLINAAQGLLAVAIEIGLMYAAILLWKAGAITIGDFALIQAYLIRAFDRLWSFGNVLRRTYEAFADATEMVDIMNTPHAIQDKPNAGKLHVTESALEFRDVGFSYQMTREVLADFNLKIAPREKVALVGPSGAGKTTVVKLLFRFFDATKNGIYIDGQNIADVTQKSLRKHIALVPQEPILFHRTLMDNIRYGRRGATDAEVIEAAKKAHCYEFISQYSEGFSTYVGERGVKLSGGERQRVAIARAILKNAPILVLDEATSSLDSESEALIQDALSELMKGKTVIVIAHRLSTIMKMDRIVVMQGGKVLTSGTHEKLIAEPGGLYKKLWDIQAGGFLGE